MGWTCTAPDIFLDPCEAMPCGENALCVNLGDGSYECTSEIDTPCDSECAPEEVCMPQPGGGYACESGVSLCNPNPCPEGYACVDDGGDYHCDGCPPGHSGQYCENADVCWRPSITFNVTNLEAGPNGDSLMFYIGLGGPQLALGDNTYPITAYVGLQTGAGRDLSECNYAVTPPPIPPTQSMASAEDTLFFDGPEGLSLTTAGNALQTFERVNAVVGNGGDPAAAGQAGDLRTYVGGTARIEAAAATMVAVSNLSLTFLVHYPVSIGTGQPTNGFGSGSIDRASSDPNFVVYLDNVGSPNDNHVDFQFSSMTPVVQACYGSYNVQVTVYFGTPDPSCLGPADHDGNGLPDAAEAPWF